MTGPSTSQHLDNGPLNQDPAWVREKYDEAKELLAEVHELRASLPDDLLQRVDNFYMETFMDACTTFGPDCACNGVDAMGRKGA